MPVARNAIHKGALLIGGAVLVTAAVITDAIAADVQRADAAAVSSACKTERQQAWFARQLRMREGDNEPLQPPEPAACTPMESGKRTTADGNAAPSAAASSAKERR